MYLPEAFNADAHAAADCVRRHPLATLVRCREGIPLADPVPLIAERDDGPLRVLQGHVARANPLAAEAAAGCDVLAIFHGPNAYVSPGWYATKREHGRVVPTWNYLVVQVRGRLRTMQDPAALRAFLERLTARQEADRPEPWRITDAPADYIERLLRAIVGIEIEVVDIVAKQKASQNQPLANREGVIHGLQGTEGGAAMASLMAALHD